LPAGRERAGVIVVATDDFEVYHGVVNELRDRGATFTTAEVGAELPEGAEVVITAAGEPAAGGEQVEADPEAPREAVAAALARLRADAGRTVVGVDPGVRPGVAVLDGDTVTAAFQVPLAEAAGLIREEVADAADPLVRIGDGARVQGAQLIDDLDDVAVELVDEAGTTPHLGAGARGMDDVLAAVNIARREGEVVDRREVDPTAGELSVIKRRSRERASDNRAIDERLARKVAAGDLTLDEALARHRNEGEGEGDAEN
jgi:hypothetical protein